MGKSYQSHKFKNFQSNIYDKTSEKSTAHGQSENFVLYYDSPLSFWPGVMPHKQI